MTDKTKAKLPTIEKSYKLTPYDRRAIETYLARKKRKPFAPRVKVSAKDGAATLAVEYTDPAIALEALGTRDFDFLHGLIKQLCNVGSNGSSVDEDGLNFMLSVVKDIEPRDQVEAMLAAQMAATHNAIMTFARRLNHVENIPQQDSAERAFNKLARTFAVVSLGGALLEQFARLGIVLRPTLTIVVEAAKIVHGQCVVLGNGLRRGFGSPAPRGLCRRLEGIL